MSKLHLSVCYYHINYRFKSEPTLCRLDIWNLSNYKVTQTHKHLVRKGTLNYLGQQAKWFSRVVSTYFNVAFHCMLLSCHVCISECIHTPSFPDRKATRYSKQAQCQKLKCSIKCLIVHINFRYCPYLEQELHDIQGNIECWFNPKCLRDMILTYSQMHHTEK